MATIVREALEGARGGDPWSSIAQRIVDWSGERGLPLRDAIVLVPFAQLLTPARRAFAALAGWTPRIETSKTLAASLGPAPLAQPGQLSFDTTLDRMSAAALLRAQAWGLAWRRRDPRAFEQGVRALTSTAQALAQAAFALPADVRPAHWADARELLGPASGPGATERLLARVALEWAALAPPPASDRLFALRPSAWIVVQAGGPDALAATVLANSARPALLIDTNARPEQAFDAGGPDRRPQFALCEGFEHEAQCAAAQVLAHLRRGETPVALIAADRLLVRRIRALLARERVPLLDETGWKLSTTRAAARIVTLLRAARSDAGTDALLDWLKSGTAWTHGSVNAAVTELEAACRRLQLGRVAALEAAPLGPAAARLWTSARDTLQAFAAAPRQGLGAWLSALAAALDACGALALLQRDDAGRQLLSALHLAGTLLRAGGSGLRTSTLALSMHGFSDWVDGVLEDVNYLPEPPVGVLPQVVITPLARAMLRPFAAVVCPGADDRHLGAAPPATGLLNDQQNQALGLPTAAERRVDELCAFAHLLALPRLTLMRSRVDGKDPLVDSALVERLSMALARRGRSLAAWHDPRDDLSLTPTPIHMSAPSAPALLPTRLSASSSEALRACPYRFFALQMLRLREDDELEREVDKRDYGNWLHAVLHDFHARRAEPEVPEVEVATLFALAEQQRVAQGIADADFLPFAASFASFAPRYIAWLHPRDAAGVVWRGGEDALSAFPDEFEGTEMHGVIDRIDEWRDANSQSVFELIDYKTGGAAGLKEKVREPLEDTQLAFYAALMRAHTDLPLRARYLPLDGKESLTPIEHPDVEASAAALVSGLGHDLRRLRAGAGMPALGEGITCAYCAARGVCRRDQWSEVPA